MERNCKQICMIVYTDYQTDTRVRREAETLAELPGYRVTVLAPKKQDKPARCNIEGVELIELNENKYYGKSKAKYIFSYLKFTCLALFTCARLFFSGKIDIVHVHNMPNFLVFSAAVPKFFGKNVILDLHDTVPETYAAKFGNENSLFFSAFCLEESIACGFANHIICVNHIQRETLQKRGVPKGKITICMNVPDPKLFTAKTRRKIKDRNDENFNLVYHGTIAKRLGIDLVLQAIARLKNEIPNIKFWIWGRGGGDLADILRVADEIKIKDKIKYQKPVPLSELIPKLLNMDIGIIGNRKNAATQLMLPVKMLEYIALNIPVVVPRLRGIEYYFSDKMVSYYEPENIDSMAEAILRLYRDPLLQRTQTENARAFLEQYGWETHKMDLIDLYNKLLG